MRIAKALARSVVRINTGTAPLFYVCIFTLLRNAWVTGECTSSRIRICGGGGGKCRGSRRLFVSHKYYLLARRIGASLLRARERLCICQARMIYIYGRKVTRARHEKAHPIASIFLFVDRRLLCLLAPKILIPKVAARIGKDTGAGG